MNGNNEAAGCQLCVGEVPSSLRQPFLSIVESARKPAKPRVAVNQAVDHLNDQPSDVTVISCLVKDVMVLTIENESMIEQLLKDITHMKSKLDNYTIRISVKNLMFEAVVH